MRKARRGISEVEGGAGVDGASAMATRTGKKYRARELFRQVGGEVGEEGLKRRSTRRV